MGDSLSHLDDLLNLITTSNFLRLLIILISNFCGDGLVVRVTPTPQATELSLPFELN